MKTRVALVSLFFLFTFAYSQDWTTLNTANSGLASDEVRTICIDDNGIKWFGTDHGLNRFDGSTWQTYVRDDAAKQTLAGDVVNDIDFEVSGYGPEIWLSTQSGVSVMGVVLDAITQATPYRTDNTDLVSNTVRAVDVDDYHFKWFGTEKGVSKFSGSEWTSFSTLDYLSNDDIRAIDSDGTGWKYFATKGGGVSRLFDNGVDAITAPSPYDYAWSGLLSDSIFAVYVLENGNQWFGTDFGAAFHEGTETKAGWTVYTKDEGLVHNFVQAIAEDKNGAMWFGTRGGVSRFDGATWTSFTTANGLAGDVVYDIAVDTDGSLWFGTDRGISFYAGNTSVARTTEMAQMSGYALYPGYPNPFNASTTIEYALARPAHVRMEIFNMRGQIVAILVDAEQPAGEFRVSWDGCTSTGLPANSGVYLVSMTAADAQQAFRASHKVLLVK
jgi:hypothetical protein